MHYGCALVLRAAARPDEQAWLCVTEKSLGAPSKRDTRCPQLHQHRPLNAEPLRDPTTANQEEKGRGGEWGGGNKCLGELIRGLR